MQGKGKKRKQLNSGRSKGRKGIEACQLAMLEKKDWVKQF